MTGRPSSNTRRLHLELGGFLRDRDWLNDELPYWDGGRTTPRHSIFVFVRDKRQAFDENRGFSTGEDFARYMIDCFGIMYGEGAEHPK